MSLNLFLQQKLQEFKRETIRKKVKAGQKEAHLVLISFEAANRKDCSCYQSI